MATVTQKKNTPAATFRKLERKPQFPWWKMTDGASLDCVLVSSDEFTDSETGEIRRYYTVENIDNGEKLKVDAKKILTEYLDPLIAEGAGQTIRITVIGKIKAKRGNAWNFEVFVQET